MLTCLCSAFAFDARYDLFGLGTKIFSLSEDVKIAWDLQMKGNPVANNARVLFTHLAESMPNLRQIDGVDVSDGHKVQDMFFNAVCWDTLPDSSLLLCTTSCFWR